MKCVELLTGVEEVPWNKKSREGVIPLMEALKMNKLDIAKVLLRCDLVDDNVEEMWAR